jgi:DNA-binding GntR family transcriptional regulator
MENQYGAVPQINTRSLKEQVYDYLRHQIHSREIKPGSGINMDATSRQLGISKTPLRDALLQLEMEGFVTISPRRGVVVNSLSLDDIRNFYQVIGALESASILAICEQLTAADLKKMKTLNKGMAEAIKANSFFSYYEQNLEFHNIYLEPCRNQTLLKTINNLKKRLYDFQPAGDWIREWEEQSTKEHQQLINLLGTPDAQAAADYVRDVHWSFAVQEKYIRNYYFREA